MRAPAETLPEHPSLEAAIASLDLSPPPQLTLSPRTPNPKLHEASGLELAPPSSPNPIVPVIVSSAPPPRSAPGRDIEAEERAKRRTTLLVVASLWTFAFALVGTLLFMINRS